MLAAATKYSKLPAAQERRAAASPAAAPKVSTRGGSHKPVARFAVPILRKSLAHDLDGAAREIHRMNVESSQARSGLNIYIPPPRSLSQGDWRFQELREGGCLHRYLNVMRHQTRARWEAVGHARAGFRQNPKSDLQLMASIPAYDYFRWLRMDQHFFRDPKNLRALKRDNAHVTSVFV